MEFYEILRRNARNFISATERWFKSVEFYLRGREPLLPTSAAVSKLFLRLRRLSLRIWIEVVADGKGFEPSKACTLHAFQACSFNRSDTHLNKSRDYSENLKFCQISFRRATCSAFKFKTQRLEFYRSAWNFITLLVISPQRSKFCRATKPSRFALPSRAAILLGCVILKFRLSLKFGLIARRGAKFKKRKQIFLSYIRLRRKSWATL